MRDELTSKAELFVTVALGLKPRCERASYRSPSESFVDGDAFVLTRRSLRRAVRIVVNFHARDVLATVERERNFGSNGSVPVLGEELARAADDLRGPLGFLQVLPCICALARRVIASFRFGTPAMNSQ